MENNSDNLYTELENPRQLLKMERRTPDTSPASSPVKGGQESPIMDSREMQVSPVAKGVGIFSLEGSPTIGGQMEEPMKDPKVGEQPLDRQQLVVQVFG